MTSSGEVSQGLEVARRAYAIAPWYLDAIAVLAALLRRAGEAELPPLVHALETSTAAGDAPAHALFQRASAGRKSRRCSICGAREPDRIIFRRRIEIRASVPIPRPMAETLHLVCPHCAAVNRIPSPRLTESPKCGQCHASLFTGHPTELDSANFRKFIERNEVPVVVDFWAPWCGPCQMMAPEYAAATAELEPKVRLAKLNTDAAPGIAGEFSIRGIPTLICFKAGNEIARQSGAMNRVQIVRWALSHVGGVRA